MVVLAVCTPALVNTGTTGSDDGRGGEAGKGEMLSSSGTVAACLVCANPVSIVLQYVRDIHQ